LSLDNAGPAAEYFALTSMKTARSIVQSVIVAGLIAVACWNVADYTATVFALRTVSTDVAGWDKLWEPMRGYLANAGYQIGDLGFVTTTSVRNGTMTEEEGLHRFYLYYAVIPLNLVPNKLDAPYVVGHFLRGKPDNLPPGLIEVYDPGNGLILLKSTR
jgi:hypothetical protein